MSINVNSLTLPPSVLTQVVTAVNATYNETATKEVVLDPTGLLLAYKNINKSFGAVYLNNNTTATAISIAGTFVLFTNSGLQLNSLSSNFALTAGVTPALSSRLTYNGTMSAPFKVSCTVSYLCAGANNQNVTTQLILNGVLIPFSKQSSNTVSANFSKSSVMEAMVTLNTNDYVEVQLTNTTASNNITLTDVNLSAFSLH